MTAPEVPVPSGGTDLRAHVAAEVRAWMARKNVKAARAATLLGTSSAYLYRRLSGETAFDVDDLQRLAILLDIPVETFFAGRDQGNMTGYFPGLLDDPAEVGRAA